MHSRSSLWGADRVGASGGTGDLMRSPGKTMSAQPLRCHVAWGGIFTILVMGSSVHEVPRAWVAGAGGQAARSSPHTRY